LHTVDAHIFGLDHVVEKIIQVLQPHLKNFTSSLASDAGELCATAAYVTISSSIRASYERYRTHPADIVVDLNLGQEFTGGQSIWLDPETYRIEGE